MAINIKKRDGAIVPFCAQKIIDAINKAFIEVDGKLYEEDTAISISKDITNAAIDAQSRGAPLTVEEVQNLVEEELMDSERKDVARAYIRYRYKKEVAREKRADFDKAIEEKLLGTNKENKNANLDETSFGGRMGEAADVVMRDYALNNLISEKARKNHLENRIYIHDLSHYVLGDHNCLTIPFDDLLAKGFNTRQIDIRPANSINTAFQLVAVIFQLQSLCQFGRLNAAC